MEEVIVKIRKGPKHKKYTAIVKHKITKMERIIHFGANGYQQYRDSTPLKLYKKYDHGDIKRMRRYYSRHSGTDKRLKAIKIEKQSSGYTYTPKILSHLYLW